jgi:signal transduction histidine kinase
MSKGEKKLMTIVNSAVSHEIRNPINSIRCQNLLLKMLNERLNDIIDDHYSSIEAFKKDLINILEQYEESVEFQVSNEKNLTFLVNNFLDL